MISLHEQRVAQKDALAHDTHDGDFLELQSAFDFRTLLQCEERVIILSVHVEARTVVILGRRHVLSITTTAVDLPNVI